MNKKLFLIVLLAFGLQACSEAERQPMSRSSQCITHGYWCEWPTCGPCAGDEPSRHGSPFFRHYRGAPWESRS